MRGLWVGYLENLKASDVQDANEGGALSLGPVQGLVDAVDQPAEQPLVGGLSQGLYRKVSLEDGTETQTFIFNFVCFGLVYLSKDIYKISLSYLL